MLPNKCWGIALLVCSDGDWLRNATQWMMRDLFVVDVFGKPNDPPSVFELEAYARENRHTLQLLLRFLRRWLSLKQDEPSLLLDFYCHGARGVICAASL